MTSSSEFSEKAIGIISNHGDHHFYQSQWDKLYSHGLKHFVYMGPLTQLDRNDTNCVINLIEEFNLQLVYGKPPERLSINDVYRDLPHGVSSLQLNGVMFRYFLPNPDSKSEELYSHIEYDLSLEQQQDLLLKCMRETDVRILVIGSGSSMSHLVCDSDAKHIIDKQSAKTKPVSIKTNEIDLNANLRHIIFTPPSRTHRCCILDPERNVLVVYHA
jgi:hypothetical protein